MLGECNGILARKVDDGNAIKCQTECKEQSQPTVTGRHGPDFFPGGSGLVLYALHPLAAHDKETAQAERLIIRMR